MALSNLSRLQRMALLSMATAIFTMAVKAGAWWVTGSVGLLSDALESIVNLSAAAFAFFVLTLAAQPADDEHPFGHDKAEYFAAGAEGLLIMVAAAAIVSAAWQRLANPQALMEMGLGLGLALIATAANAATAWQLFRVAKAEDSLALRADAAHLMSDVWTTVGIVAALCVAWFVPDYLWLDAAIAIVVAAWLFVTGLKVIAPAVAGLMDEALPKYELEKIHKVVANLLPEHAELVAMRTRKAGRRRFIDANLLVPGALSVTQAHALSDQLEEAIRKTIPGCDITLHIAPVHERDTHC